MDYRVGSVYVSVKELADMIHRLYNQRKRSPHLFQEEEDSDIRLQVVDGQWFFHTGDSQYDTDHKGFWGYLTLPTDGNDRNTQLEVARDLIQQAQEQHAGGAR